MPKEFSNEIIAPDFGQKSLAELLNTTPRSPSEYNKESQLWKDLNKLSDPLQPTAAESVLPKFLLRPQNPDACILSVYPGPDRKIEMTGNGCEFELVPKTAEEKEADRLRREYEQTPEGQREIEEKRRLSRTLLR